LINFYGVFYFSKEFNLLIEEKVRRTTRRSYPITGNTKEYSLMDEEYCSGKK